MHGDAFSSQLRLVWLGGVTLTSASGGLFQDGHLIQVVWTSSKMGSRALLLVMQVRQ